MTEEDGDVLFRQVNLAIKERRAVDLWRDRKTELAILGIPILISPEVIILQVLDEALTYAGVVVVASSDVTRIRSGTREHGIVDAEGVPLLEVPEVAGLAMTSAATVLSRRFGPITVETENGMMFSGDLVDVDDDWISLKAFDQAQSMNRSEVVIRLSMVIGIEADTRTLKSFVSIYSRGG